MSLCSDWYMAAWDHEIKQAPFARTICRQPIVFYRQTSGALSAFEDRCPHRLLPLSKDYLQGDHLVCKYHGLTFDACDWNYGKCDDAGDGNDDVVSPGNGAQFSDGGPATDFSDTGRASFGFSRRAWTYWMHSNKTFCAVRQAARPEDRFWRSVREKNCGAGDMAATIKQSDGGSSAGVACTKMKQSELFIHSLTDIPERSKDSAPVFKNRHG
jgi:nitrite reductase/ring-hydroxylating ferredoxin subunit